MNLAHRTFTCRPLPQLRMGPTIQPDCRASDAPLSDRSLLAWLASSPAGGLRQRSGDALTEGVVD